MRCRRTYVLNNYDKPPNHDKGGKLHFSYFFSYYLDFCLETLSNYVSDIIDEILLLDFIRVLSFYDNNYGIH